MPSMTLLRELRASVRVVIGDAPEVAVAYSGGIDSSLVAALAAEVARTECYAAVVPGSHDDRTVRASAEEEGRAIEVIVLDDPELRAEASKAVALVGHESPSAVAYTIPLITVIGRAKQRILLAGNGADELFGGYAKYLTSENPQAHMQSDLTKALAEASGLNGYAVGLGKMIEYPFLSQNVREFACALPLDNKLLGTTRKVILREIARGLRLPSHDRPKKAAQYSSGVLRRLHELAKAEGMPLEKWLMGL